MAFIPDEAVYSAQEISHAAFKLFACYCAHRNRKTGLSWPSRDAIHHETGICTTYVSTLKGELTQKRWIEIVENKVRPLRGFSEEAESNNPTLRLRYSTRQTNRRSDDRTSTSNNSTEQSNCRTGESNDRTAIKEEPANEPIQEPSHEPLAIATSSRKEDPFYIAFVRAFREHSHEVLYQHRKADFIQLAALKNSQNEALLCERWTIAVSNYFATPRSRHTLADLCENFATFQQYPLDRYNRPVRPALVSDKAIRTAGAVREFIRGAGRS